MRRAFLMSFALVATGLFAWVAFGESPANEPADPDAQRRAYIDPQVASMTQAVLRAPTPSAAVEAYGRNYTMSMENLDLQKAYVRRMVDFGMPELADAQASAVVERDPHDGLAWGVLAANAARAGRMPQALERVGAAVRYAPDEPMNQRVAGELVAWYDMKARQSRTEVPTLARDAALQVRHALKYQKANFEEAYKRGVAYYEKPRLNDLAARQAAGSRLYNFYFFPSGLHYGYGYIGRGSLNFDEVYPREPRRDSAKDLYR